MSKKTGAVCMDALIEWRTIPGFPGYEASNSGQVRFLRNGEIRKLRLYPGPKGDYRIASVRSESGKRMPKGVHTLIALAFIGPRPSGLQVSHLDGNPNNNRASNLTYETPLQNIRRAEQHGTRKFVSPPTSAYFFTTILKINGESRKASEWCKLHGISMSTYLRRIRAGWKPEIAATKAPMKHHSWVGRVFSHRRGSQHPHSSIDENTAKQIIELKGKMGPRKIAEKLKISRFVAFDILSGRRWKHLPR